MSTQFCSSCGEKIAGDSSFCPNCGKSVNQAAQQATPEITETNDSRTQAAKSKNKIWLYGALAVAAAIFIFVTFVNPGPEKVAEEFVILVGSFEFEKAQKLTSKHDYMYNEIEYVLEELRSNQVNFKDQLEYAKEEGLVIESLVINDNDQTKDTATIRGVARHKNGDYNDVYMELVKESGKWKVSYMD